MRPLGKYSWSQTYSTYVRSPPTFQSTPKMLAYTHFEKTLALAEKTVVLPTTKWGSKLVSYSVWCSIMELQSDRTNRSIGNQTWVCATEQLSNYCFMLHVWFLGLIKWAFICDAWLAINFVLDWLVHARPYIVHEGTLSFIYHLILHSSNRSLHLNK